MPPPFALDGADQGVDVRLVAGTGVVAREVFGFEDDAVVADVTIIYVRPMRTAELAVAGILLQSESGARVLQRCIDRLRRA